LNLKPENYQTGFGCELAVEADAEVRHEFRRIRNGIRLRAPVLI
jgi:hypothetical protein